MISKFFAAFGFTALLFWLFGALGIGNFYVYYGPDAVHCTKEKHP